MKLKTFSPLSGKVVLPDRESGFGGTDVDQKGRTEDVHNQPGHPSSSWKLHGDLHENHYYPESRILLSQLLKCYCSPQ